MLRTLKIIINRRAKLIVANLIEAAFPPINNKLLSASKIRIENSRASSSCMLNLLIEMHVEMKKQVCILFVMNNGICGLAEADGLCSFRAFNVCVLHNEAQEGECLQRQTLADNQLMNSCAYVLLRIFKNVNSLMPTFK